METTHEFPRPIVLSKKRQLIDAAGFRYHLDCGVYFNSGLKKAFSLQYLAAHDELDVEACLNEPPNGAWQFYFNVPPTPGVREQLEIEFS